MGNFNGSLPSYKLEWLWLLGNLSVLPLQDLQQQSKQHMDTSNELLVPTRARERPDRTEFVRNLSSPSQNACMNTSSDKTRSNYYYTYTKPISIAPTIENNVGTTTATLDVGSCVAFGVELPAVGISPQPSG